jgi:hypothetical protein
MAGAGVGLRHAEDETPALLQVRQQPVPATAATAAAIATVAVTATVPTATSGTRG